VATSNSPTPTSITGIQPPRRRMTDNLRRQRGRVGDATGIAASAFTLRL
jgi:hypothetical protein